MTDRELAAFEEVFERQYARIVRRCPNLAEDRLARKEATLVLEQLARIQSERVIRHALGKLRVFL
jgi:hypothetical protein